MLLQLRKRLRSSCAALCAVSLLLSPATIASAQQPTPESLEEFLKAATEAAKSREAELGEIRAMLKEVLGQNRALEGQLKAAMEMQARALAIQADNLTDEAKQRLVDQAKEIAAEGREALDAAADKLKSGATEAERKLGEQVDKLKSLIPSDDEIATMGEEQLEKLKREIERVKEDIDTEIREYVKDLADDLKSQCPGNGKDSSALIAAARAGATDQELADQAAALGCKVGSDLLNRLANARTAEEAKAAFQASMSSMMMLAIYTGNPYVIAAVAIITLIAALFSDGGGGSGSGDGEGEGSGGEGGGEQVAGGGEQGGGQEGGEQQGGGETPAPPTPPKPGTEEGGAGSSTEVQLQAGSGCTVNVDASGDTLTIVPGSVYKPYSIKLSSIAGTRPDNFPSSWTDRNLTLSACDGENQSLYVWLHLSPQASALCYVIYKKEDAYHIGDQEYAVNNTGRSCVPL